MKVFIRLFLVLSLFTSSIAIAQPVQTPQEIEAAWTVRTKLLFNRMRLLDRQLDRMLAKFEKRCGPIETLTTENPCMKKIRAKFDRKQQKRNP